jgi:hypothetical protein
VPVSSLLHTEPESGRQQRFARLIVGLDDTDTKKEVENDVRDLRDCVSRRRSTLREQFNREAPYLSIKILDSPGGKYFLKYFLMFPNSGCVSRSRLVTTDASAIGERMPLSKIARAHELAEHATNRTVVVTL